MGATWFTTPFIFMFLLLVRKSPLNTEMQCLKEALHPVVFYPLKVLISYFISALCVYIVIPVFNIGMGLCDIFCPECLWWNPKTTAVYDAMPAFKIPEQLGEAIPQFTIAVVFFSNNADWLSPWEMTQGYVTMILSCGGILMGMYNGITAILKINAELES